MVAMAAMVVEKERGGWVIIILQTTGAGPYLYNTPNQHVLSLTASANCRLTSLHSNRKGRIHPQQRQRDVTLRCDF